METFTSLSQLSELYAEMIGRAPHQTELRKLPKADVIKALNMPLNALYLFAGNRPYLAYKKFYHEVAALRGGK